MKKILLLAILFLSISTMYAVHNLTVNGSTSTTISVGDSLRFEFEFESVGNSADFELSIEILEQQIPLFSGNYLLFQDGGLLDETGIDGYFAGGFSNFVQFPEGTTLVVTLTDENVSEYVEIEFEQLNTDFSIAGTVLQEGGWIDLPVMGALVWTVYNGSAEFLIELFENFELETFLEFINGDHYLLSDLTGFLGTYQIFVPQEIPDVACATGVYSMLDINGEFIAPETQEVTVNGHVTGIDFFYAEPDGNFYGQVSNSDGEAITEAIILIENPNSMIPWLHNVDDTGAFNIALADGTYNYSVSALGYETYLDSVTIAGDDVYQEIILEESGITPDASFYGFVLNEAAEPVVNAQIMIIPIEPAGDPQTIYSMGDGSFDILLQNGYYSYMVSHDWYIGETGDFTIAAEDIYLEIVLTEVSATEETLPDLTNLKCYPNPFNPQTTISFSLSSAQHVNLSIYNIKGEVVYSLLNNFLPQGNYRQTWLGYNQNGIPVSSGVYYYSLTTDSDHFMGKVLLIK